MTKQVLCMNPGPIEFEPRVLQSFAMEGISHVDPTVLEVFGHCLEKLRQVVKADDGQPLVVAGSGTLGWDMVGANLVRLDDNVLVINNGTLCLLGLGRRLDVMAFVWSSFIILWMLCCSIGYFGDNFAECLQHYGAKITHIRGKVNENHCCCCCMVYGV